MKKLVCVLIFAAGLLGCAPPRGQNLQRQARLGRVDTHQLPNSVVRNLADQNKRFQADKTVGRFVPDNSAASQLSVAAHLACFTGVFHYAESSRRTENVYASAVSDVTLSRQYTLQKIGDDRFQTTDTASDGNNGVWTTQFVANSDGEVTAKITYATEPKAAAALDYTCDDEGVSESPTVDTGYFILADGTKFPATRTASTFTKSITCSGTDRKARPSETFAGATISEVRIVTNRIGASADPCAPGVTLMDHREVLKADGTTLRLSHEEITAYSLK